MDGTGGRADDVRPDDSPTEDLVINGCCSIVFTDLNFAIFVVGQGLAR